MSSKIYQQQVRDTTQTTGTGTITLDGQFVYGQGKYLGSLAVNGDTTTLVIQDGFGNVELVEGTVYISGSVATFTRDNVLRSSNDGKNVSFPAGAKSVTGLAVSDGLRVQFESQMLDVLEIVRDMLE